MTFLRVQQTVLTTLSKVFYVDGQPTDASGNVTVNVKRLDGTSVSSGNATHANTGRYTYVLPAQPNVDALTVDWSGVVAGGSVTLRDFVEIVGGFFWELAEVVNELRIDTNRYPLDTVAAKRILVEQECESIRRQAQVPRFARFIVDGTGTDELVVPDMELRRCRAAKVAGWANGQFTDLDPASVAAEPSGVLVLNGTWPAGRRNVIVEYEYGLDYPQETIRVASLRRLQYWLASSKTAIPDRAVTWTSNEGGTYRLTQAGPRATGIPDVDAAYQRGMHHRVWIA